MSRIEPNRKRATAMAVAATLVLVLCGTRQLRLEAQDVSEADSLYRQGLFDKAEPLYAKAAAADPSSYSAALGLGRIYLLRNALDKAAIWLEKAAALKPAEQEPKGLLGEALYRRDDYARAAPLFESIGRKAKAEKLRAFKDRRPFLIESGPGTSSIKFIQTDPLPSVELEVNGLKGAFLIDTGAFELHVTPGFADKCGLQRLTETQTAVYAGGHQAATANAIADRVRMGDFTLRNVPVVIPLGPGGRPVDGVIGTVVLYHFISSLDYPGGQLILRRNTQEMSRAVRADADAAGAIRMPFWLAGDHLMHAWGTVNGAGPYLFFVDTGMGGGGFDCPDSVIEEAKIELAKEGFTGRGGGGGQVTVYPFTVDLTLGGAREAKVRGLHGAVPPGPDDRFGFRTGGLISHAFFRPYVVTFDFGAMTLYMTRTAP